MCLDAGGKSLPHQLHIQRAVERLAGALRLPQCFAEALQNFVFCGVLVVVLACELRMDGADAVRLIDVELFLNGQMKSEVQKRIDVASLRSPIGGDKRRWIFEHAVIFRMQRDDHRRFFFERR